jgi:tetratricopeptide (TPR) repeat protein
MSKKGVDLIFSIARENSKRERKMTKLESIVEAKLDKYYEEGESYFLQEDYPMAISSFEKAIEAAGEDLYTLYGYTNNYYTTRHEQREAYPELYIKDAGICLSLGKALLRQNSIEPTEDFVEKSIKVFEKPLPGQVCNSLAMMNCPKKKKPLSGIIRKRWKSIQIMRKPYLY